MKRSRKDRKQWEIVVRLTRKGKCKDFFEYAGIYKELLFLELELRQAVVSLIKQGKLKRFDISKNSLGKGVRPEFQRGHNG